MTGPDPKADLRRCLQAAHETLLWKLDGLSEYDIRRPLTPTGTNLLGLIREAPECRAVLRLSNGRTMRGRDSAESALIDAVTPAGIGDTGLPVNITAALNPAGLDLVAPVASADQVAELAPVGAAAGPALEEQSS